MKSIYDTLSFYFKSYFHIHAYLAIGILLVVLISLNYYLDIEDYYIDSIHSFGIRFGSMFLFQSMPYLISIYIIYYFQLIQNPFNKKGFWISILVGFICLALDRSVNFSMVIHQYFLELNFSYTTKVSNFLSGLFFIILPLTTYAYLTKDKYNIYGLFGKFKGIKLYFYLLIGSFICVFIGGFFSDIQSYYPIYLQDNPNYFQQETKVPNLISIILYEIPYAISFISVELFFRGFLIFAFLKYLGKYAILPMAVTYCVLHFGKPITEAISSIFGGIILGVVALKHQNIRGGILIHVGMAWSMEVIGYIHKII